MGAPTRHDVVQAALDLFDGPAYLEIGVFEGDTFHAARAGTKVAVDPAFRFDVDAARADPSNAGARYHPLTSDDYFASAESAAACFDVIFLDGLHHFDQTLRDLLNAIPRLKPGGVVIIDDVLPSSYGASLRELEDAAKFRRMTEAPDAPKAWMGDVYRLVFFIRDYLPAYRYATTADNHGMLLLWRGQRPHDVPPLTVEAIARQDYKDVVFRPRAYNFKPLSEIVASIRAA